MASLAKVWLVLFAVVAVSEASHGDRDELYLRCLDKCADVFCGKKYDREYIPEEELTLVHKRQRGDFMKFIQAHLSEQMRKAQREPEEEEEEQEQQQASNLNVESVTASTANVAGGNVNNGNSIRRRLHSADEGGAGAAEVTGETGGLSGIEVVESGPRSKEGGVDAYAHSPERYLRWMGWDCVSECQYSCMTLHTDWRVSKEWKVLQYYGKWPFKRVWGVQELFSTIFSAGNGVPHAYHALFSRGTFNPPGNYMCGWLTVYPWIAVNTWLWSTVFHARDVRWTEAADYFFALMSVFYVVWIATIRLAGPPRKRSPNVRKWVPWIGVGMLLYYVLHISYMWFVKFDYGYNMKVALIFGLLHTGLWLRYFYLARDREYSRRGATILILLNAAILLEVNDFSPVFYRLVDAHAIWHMVTIPLVFAWYRVVILDAMHEASLAATSKRT